MSQSYGPGTWPHSCDCGQLDCFSQGYVTRKLVEMAQNPELSIVTPVFNEESNIPELHRRLEGRREVGRRIPYVDVPRGGARRAGGEAVGALARRAHGLGGGLEGAAVEAVLDRDVEILEARVHEGVRHAADDTPVDDQRPGSGEDLEVIAAQALSRATR